MKNILDISVSRFGNCFKPDNPIEVNLYEWLTGNEFRDDILRLRTLEDKPLRDKFKKQLPVITPSGIFTYRNIQSLVRHTGMICIDIDQKGNEQITDFESLKHELSKVKNIAYCGLSASGKGLYCIIPLSYPEKHIQQFNALQMDLEKHWGIAIDISCKDITRARGASYDAKPHINTSAVHYAKLYEPPKPKPQFKFDSYIDVNAQIKEAVSAICHTHTDISNDCYDTWFKIGCAIASELGDYGRDLFHAISSQSPKYNQSDCDKQYTHCLRDRSGISISTFFYYCKMNSINIKSTTT